MLLKQVKNILGEAGDIIYLDLLVKGTKPATIIAVDGMVNLRAVGVEIVEPLTLHGITWFAAKKEETDPVEIVRAVLAGDAVLIGGGENVATVFDSKGFPLRGINEPGQENVIKGPKDSFVEGFRPNTALIRRRLNTPDLRIENVIVGKKVQTNAAIIYLEGVAEPEKVREVQRRLESIKEQVIKSTSSVEESLKDNPWSIFPQVMYTERPDKFCANIAEGKIGIIVDGYPIAFVVPAVFNMLFQSGEDYSQNYAHGSYVRLLRYAGAFLSLIIPAFYVAITTFHHEMLPTNLMLSIIKSKQTVSFTTFLEVFALLVAFEILIEAGIRLPKSIGQAVSIIGGLVVGDAAVRASLISPAIVVVVATTGICGFVVSNSDLANSFRITRILLLISAGLAGLYGLSLGLIFVLYYLCQTTTLGAPYMTAYKDGEKAIRDGLLRLPRNKE
jgi:spore germination protein KA